MDLTNRQQLIKYLQSHGLYTKKSLGQNFLVDRGALEKIVAAAELSNDDCVIEVGPGLGVMTEELVKRAGKVVAVELDRKLVELLAERFQGHSVKIIPLFPSVIPVEAGILPEKRSPSHGLRLPEDDRKKKTDDTTIQQFSNLTIVNEDILRIDINELIKDCPAYKVVANIPYYITSKILRFFLEAEKKPETIVLLTQKEVAERICSKPGDMSVLSVSVQYYGTPEIVDIVPRSSFFPAPEVDSAILRIKISNNQFLISNKIPNPKSQIPKKIGELDIKSLGIDSTLEIRNLNISEHDFFRLIHIGFSSRRKTLLNNLSAGYRLEKDQVLDILRETGLNDKTRAQELNVAKWGELAQILEFKKK